MFGVTAKENMVSGQKNGGFPVSEVHKKKVVAKAYAEKYGRESERERGRTMQEGFGVQPTLAYAHEFSAHQTKCVCTHALSTRTR